MAASADAIACAMMAVPVLVPNNVIDVILVVSSKTKSAKLSFTFILNRSVLNWTSFGLARLTILTMLVLVRRRPTLTWVKNRVKVWEKLLRVCHKLRLAIRVQSVWINILILNPREQLLIVLLKSWDVQHGRSVFSVT